MKKRNIYIVIGVILVLAILFIPIPKKVEQRLYATDTQSGEQAIIDIDLTYLRFLILENKMIGSISLQSDNQSIVFENPWAYSVYPTNNEDEKMHTINGFWYDKINHSQIGYITYIGVNFDKMVLKMPLGENDKGEYIANIEKGKETETYNYFKGFVDSMPNK